MRTLWLSSAVTVALLLGPAAFARADEVAPPAPAEPAAVVAPTPASEPAPAAETAASPLNYVAASVTTTLFFQPNTGSSSGWQHDVGPVVGYGRYVTPTIALEMDFGPSYVRGDYANFVLVPAAIWSFSTHFYAAARFLVQLDPRLDLALFPGVGAAYSFPNNITITLEVNVPSFVGRGKPDLGITLTPGITYAF
jgi:hypothetical protein